MEAKRIKDIGNRDASQLTNEQVRVVIDDQGGMVPELSLRRENGYLNTHWIPYFRGNSGEAYHERKHKTFWAGALLYEIAGNFPCLPAFGVPSKVYGAELDVHGTTAHGKWKPETHGTLEGRAVYSISTLVGAVKGLSYRKYDLLLSGHPVHYSALKVRNGGSRSYRINAAWHNTIAPPFLEKGCLIDVSADRFATVPSPSEFDDTGRLERGMEFEDIRRAPMRNGSTLDARVVPGMVGYTDFITGAIPREATIGWSSVVNPNLEAVYVSFFKGPKSAAGSDIILSFNDLWMQYGGRKFTPWALTQGGTDQTFCLGVENSVAAFANGLEYSLANPTLLDRPTTVEIPAGSERILYYGSLAATYEENLGSGILRVESAGDRIVLTGRDNGGSQSYAADPGFSEIAKIVEELG